MQQTGVNVALSMISILHSAGPSWASSNAATLAGWPPVLAKALEVGCCLLVSTFGSACGRDAVGTRAADLTDTLQSQLQQLLLSAAAKFLLLARSVPPADSGDTVCAQSDLGFDDMPGIAHPASSPSHGATAEHSLAAAEGEARAASSPTSTERRSSVASRIDISSDFTAAAPPPPFRCDVAVAPVDSSPHLTHILLMLACKVRALLDSWAL